VDWSQTATNIVASKYFYGKMGSPERETSVAQLVERVVNTITDWGHKDGYFKSETGTARISALSWPTSCSPRRPASIRPSGSTSA
jgi:hypothetical protein